MDLSGLLFDVGHRVTGRGRLLRDAEGDWLDPNSVVPLSRGGINCRSGLAVRLLGVDPATPPAVVDESDARPSSVVVTGVWPGDAIQVETLEAHQSTDRKTPEWTTPPCPPPPDGWPHTRPYDNPDVDVLDRLEELREIGVAVTTVIFRPSDDQAVLVATWAQSLSPTSTSWSSCSRCEPPRLRQVWRDSDQAQPQGRLRMLVGGFAEQVEPPGVRSGEDVIADLVEFGAGPAAGDVTKPVGQTPRT